MAAIVRTVASFAVKEFAINFAKCVKGYHLINDDPIKESPWEDINAIILLINFLYRNVEQDNDTFIPFITYYFYQEISA